MPMPQSDSEVSEKMTHFHYTKPGPSSHNSQDLNSQNSTENVAKTVDENANYLSKIRVEEFVQEALNHKRRRLSGNTGDHSITSKDITHSANVTTRSRRFGIREFCNPPLVSDFTTTDDSTTAFIENTPAVDVNRTNKKPTVTLKENDKTKDSKDSGFGQQAESDTVECFLSHHFAENRRGDLIVNPTLARRINDLNSESRATFTQTEPHSIYAEVKECLNFASNKGCDSLEKDIEIEKNLNQNNISDNKQVGPDRTIPLEVTNIVEEEKKLPTRKAKGKTKSTPRIKLKFKHTKKQAKEFKKTNEVELKSFYKLRPIDENESELSSKNRPRILPDMKSPTDEETPLNKRKRKLYSEKDVSLINIKTGIYVSETEEDNSVLPGINKPLISRATPYKELEEMHKTAAARHLRNRKCKDTETANLFDQLKKTVESEEKVVLVDKKLISKDSVYNMSSSSEDDEDFKRKKLPRYNAYSAIVNKIKRGRAKRDSNPKDNSNGKPIKVTRSKCKQMHKTPTQPEPITDLVDERMREATAEALDTSLIIEHSKEDLNIQMEPAYKIPRVEIIPLDKACKIVTAPVASTKRRTKNISQRAKERKNTSKNKLVRTTDKNDDRKTISPLPGLEIEVAQTTDGPNDSIVMLNKFDNKHEGDSNVLDVTQNLLSESEQVNNSRSKLNITDKFDETRNTRSDSKKSSTAIEAERVRNARTSSSSSNISKGKTLVVVLDRLDIHSIKSIPTVGACPITAHGDIDESPPQVKEIDKTIRRRSLETEDFSEGALNFYNKLTDDLNYILPDKTGQHSKGPEIAGKSENELETSGSNKDINEKSPVFKMTIEKTPFISRLSQKELDRYLAPSTSKNEVSSQTTKVRTNSKNTRRVYKSIISPISFTELMFSKRPLSPEEEQAHSSKTPEPEKSISSRRYDLRKYRFLPSEEEQAHSSKTPRPEIYTPSSKRYDLRKFGKTYSAKYNSQSTRCASQVLTQSDDEAYKPVAKKPKLDGKNTSASGETQPSGASVDDWLSQNERRAPTTTVDARDEVLAGVVEKLNTTAQELHLNTRNSITTILAETKSLFERRKEQSREEIRKRQSQFQRRLSQVEQSITTILAETKSLFERKMEQSREEIRMLQSQFQRRLAQVEQSSEEDYQRLLENFESNILNVLNEALRRNHTLVTLLRDEINTAMRNTENSEE